MRESRRTAMVKMGTAVACLAAMTLLITTVYAMPDSHTQRQDNVEPSRPPPPRMTDPRDLHFTTTSAWEMMTRSASGELLRQQVEECTNNATELMSAQEMAELLVNPRHFDILSASFSGELKQFARVDYAPGCHHVSESIETAFVMSTGLASLAAVPFNEEEFSTSVFGGSAQSSAMVTNLTDTIYGKAPTLDCAIFNMSVVAKRSASLQFEYIFASEEYNEFVGVGFVDAFGLFVNGQNYATLQDGSPITIDQVNLEKNAEQFVDHPAMAAYDGYTTLLSTVGLDVKKGDQLEFSLQICDAFDALYDSALMIVANSIDLCSGVTEIMCEKSSVVGECKNGEAMLDVGGAVAQTCDEFLPAERIDDFFPVDTFPLGNSTATYQATDPATGESATCSVKVVVQDTQPPIMQCFVEQISAECVGSVTPVDLPCATARDACEGPVPTVRTDEFAETNEFPLGVSTATYQSSDSNGLTSSCDITVQVVDTTAPVIQTFRVLDDKLIVGDKATFVVSVADACSGVTWTINYGDGSSQGTDLEHEYEAIGEYTAVLAAFDQAGNIATATLVLHVVGGCGHASGDGVVRSPRGAIVAYPEVCSFARFSFRVGKRVVDGRFYGDFDYRILYTSLRFKSYLISAADFGDDGSLVIVGEGRVGDRRQYKFVAEFDEGGQSVDKMRFQLYDLRNDMALAYDSLMGAEEGELARLESGGYRSSVKECEIEDDTDDDLPVCRPDATPSPAPRSDSSSSSSDSDSEDDKSGRSKDRKDREREREQERNARETERERERREREHERTRRENERERAQTKRGNDLRNNRHARRFNGDY